MSVLVSAIADKLDVRSEADGDLAEVAQDVDPVAVLEVIDAAHAGYPTIHASSASLAASSLICSGGCLQK